RIRAEQVGVIRRYLPWMMLANAFNAVVLVAALWKSPDKSLALGWASLVIGFAALHGRKASGASGQPPVSERTVRRAVGNAFLLGSLWAALPVVFFRRRIEQRATRHHLPMRRDAGGRRARVREHSRGGDRIRDPNLHRFGSSDRTKRRSR